MKKNPEKFFEEFGKIKINEGVERKRKKVEVIKGRQFKRTRR